MSGIVNSLETESRLVVAGSWGRGVKEDCLVGTEFPLGDEMFATGWKWCLHNFVNVLDTTKLFIFRLRFCYEDFTSILKKNYKLNRD